MNDNANDNTANASDTAGQQLRPGRLEICMYVLVLHIRYIFPKPLMPVIYVINIQNQCTLHS